MRKKRQVYFVCSAIIENKLKNKIVPAMSSKEAASSFYEEFNIKPEDILGPFWKKREYNVITPQEIKFSHVSKKAEYNGWFVTAFLLNEPKDHAYLIFVKKIDGSIENKPTNSIIVPIDSLRFENV